MTGRAFAVGAVVAVTLLAGCGSGARDADRGPAPAVTTVSGTVWVANEGADSLTAIDARTGSVRATVRGVTAPHNVQASPDGRRVWAVTGSDQLVSLPTATLRLEHVAQTDKAPAHVVGTPDGGVLVTASAQPSVYAYDAALRPVRRTGLTGSPHGIRLSADGAVALVANTGSGTLDIVDTGHGVVRARVAVGKGPVQAAVSADGRTGFVSLGKASQVVRVDVHDGVVTRRVDVPSAPAQVFLTSTGRLLVANQGTPEQPGTTLSVLDGATLRELGRVRVGAGPHGVVADPAGRVAWVTNLYDGTVSTVDLAAMSQVAVTRVGTRPNGVSLSTTTMRGSRPREVSVSVPPREDRAGGHSHSSGH